MNEEKVVGVTGSVSGITSVLGSWQICHNICLGAIALLSLLGITVTGMPLMFLSKLTIPFWTLAFLLLIVLLVVSIKKKCVFKNLLLLNSGLIIAGTPLEPLQRFRMGFWVVGGILVLISVSIFIRNKIQKRREQNEKRA